MPEKKSEVAGETSPSEPKTIKPAAEPSVAKPRPAESGDPAVHQLLAIRHAHELVLRGDVVSAHERESAELSIVQVDAQLADMGYEIG